MKKDKDTEHTYPSKPQRGTASAIRGSSLDDSLRLYIDYIRKIPLLTFEEELDLSQEIQKGNEASRRKLIEANLRLVVKIARAYLAHDISLMDLVQEGNIGLMRAVEKYDHEKQVRFSTYAAWWIRQSISRYLSDKRRTIRLPHRKEEILHKIHKAYHSLSQTYMRQPKADEIAVEIGVPKKDVEFLINLSQDFLPFDAEINGKESSAVVEYHEDYTYSPERALMRKNSQEAALNILGRLKERERSILMYRYQLNGETRHTLKKVSDMLGLSIETIRQIELKAFQKLRSQADELQTHFEAMAIG